MEHITKQFKFLIEKTKNKEQFGNIFILKGEKGLGQHDVYQSYLEYIKNDTENIYFDVRSTQNTVTYSIWTELKKYVDMSYEGVSSDNNKAVNQGLNYEEFLISHLISVGKNTAMYFFCEDIQQCNEELLAFLKKIMNVVLPNTLTTMVICLYTDSRDSERKSGDYFIDYFSNFTHRTIYCHFKLLDTRIIQEHLHTYLNEKIKFLSDKTQNMLIEFAFGNPKRLANIIEYLKSEEIIYWDSGKLICNEFDISRLKKYTMIQYQKLDEQMKGILRGSSIIGQIFDKKLLEKPLNLLSCDDLLIRIEHLTQLIHLKIDTIYEFQNQHIHLSIENIVSSDERSFLNKALADYFWHKGLQNQQINDYIEAINDFKKSGFYYCNAKIEKKGIEVYLRLIPMAIATMQYQESISIIRKIKDINNGKPELLEKKQIDELNLKEADCCYVLFRYVEAAFIYKQFLNNDIETPLKIISIKRKYAMSLYGIGETTRPYQILNECLKELEKLRNPNRYLEIVQVLSCISSIGETIGNKEYISYFEQALGLAKDKRFTEEYHQLLRKALIVYKGKTGIRLMETALDYYKKTNNKKEYAMCLHNIATEELYDGDSENARKFFQESKDIFESFGSEGTHYPINGLGNYWCIIGDFKEAINCYQEAYNEEHEDFSKIGILINQATAHRVVKHFEKAREILKNAQQLLGGKEASTYAIIKQHLMLTMGINEYSASNYELAYSMLLEYFDQEIDAHSHRKVIAAYCLEQLCNATGEPFPNKYINLLSRTSQKINLLKPNFLVSVNFSFAE